MHYLTNYYKNLSEQLQERLNVLEAQLGYVKANTEEERRKLEAAAMRPDEGEEFEPSEVGMIIPHPDTNQPVKIVSKSEPKSKIHAKHSSEDCPTCRKIQQAKKESQIREGNQDPTNMNTSPGKAGGKNFRDLIKPPSKSKRTPEQDKAIKEWDAKYGMFAKDRPEGKPPPRPYDPDEPPPQTIG